MADDAWLDGAADLDAEIARVKAARNAEIHETREAALDAAYARLQKLLEMDVSANAEDSGNVAARRSTLMQEVERYALLVRRLAEGDSNSIPLTPPVQTLRRSSLLQKELSLIALSATSESEKEVAALVAKLHSSSAVLAQCYAAKVVRETVSPFWYANLGGTRRFMWSVNGHSLTLCGLIGVCRIILRKARRSCGGGGREEDVLARGISREVVLLLVSAFVRNAVEVFLASAEEEKAALEEAAAGEERAAEEEKVAVNKRAAVRKGPAAESTGMALVMSETTSLIVAVRRMVPLLLSEEAYQTSIRQLLEKLGQTVGSCLPEGYRHALSDAWACEVSPFTEEALLDATQRDASFVA